MNSIGIFDSGVGGLGIFQEIKKILPNENILYLADTANFPYGEKKIEHIEDLCKKNAEFLIEQGAKIIVVACNSASVMALNYLRSEFPNIPVVGVVPVVKTAAKITKKKVIGILATKATVNSNYLRGLVKEFCPNIRVCYQPAGELVEMVEDIYLFKDSDIEKKVKKYVKPLLFEGVDVIALGCTHFPFVKDKIKKIAGEHVTVLDSNGAVARQVKRVLTKNNQLLFNNEKPEYKFYNTKEKAVFKYLIKQLVNVDTDKIYLLKWKK